jgi:signal transduction histidine kinase/integral membrane sensor domain MASE1
MSSLKAHKLLIQAMALTATYYLVARFSLLLIIKPESLPIFWPPSGLLLGVLLLSQKRDWLWIVLTAFVTHFVAELSTPGQVWVGAGYALTTTSEAIVGASLLRRFVSERLTLDNTKSVLILVFLTGLVSSPLSATLGAAITRAAGTSAEYWSIWLVWWVSVALGVLAVTPVLLTLSSLRAWLSRVSKSQAAEVVLLLAAYLSAIIAIFTVNSQSPLVRLPLLSLPVPLLIWVAMRLGPAGTALTSLFTCVFGVWQTTHGHGLFNDMRLTAEQHVFLLYIYSILLVLVSLLVAAITAKRKTAEQQLRLLSERLSLAVKAAAIGVWDWDLRTNEVVWDNTMYKIYRVPKGQKTYRAWAEAVHPDDLPSNEAALQQTIAERGQGEREFRIIWPDGTIRHIQAAEAVVLDENQQPVRMVGVNIDITERKQAEHEHEQLVHDLNERVKELTTLHGVARLLQANRGVSLELLREMVSLLPAGWQYPAICEARIVYGQLQVTTPGWHDTPWKQAASFVTSDGRRGVIEVVYLVEKPVEAEGPFLIQERALILSLADMLAAHLERHQAEEALRRAYDELEARVEERTADLAAANERLKELDRLKSQFLATMSHELRTPLNSIIGFTGIMRQGMIGPINDEQKKQLNIVYNSALHLLRLINDLLDLSRIEAGKADLEREPFNFSDVVREVVETLEPLAEHKGLRLVADLPGPTIAMIGDRKRCFQVLLNLANNAVKFTEHGEVRISAREQSDRLSVCVADTGIGIKPEHIGMLFEAFRQVDGSAKRVYEGTGLGLYLCRKLLALMGGEISVESESGHGSRFMFTMPLQPAA